MTENHMYGPEVAEKIESGNGMTLKADPCGFDKIILSPTQTIHVTHRVFYDYEIIAILKQYPEYRNHAPMKALQELVGFDVQAWIDGGKK